VAKCSAQLRDRRGVPSTRVGLVRSKRMVFHQPPAGSQLRTHRSRYSRVYNKSVGDEAESAQENHDQAEDGEDTLEGFSPILSNPLVFLLGGALAAPRAVGKFVVIGRTRWCHSSKSWLDCGLSISWGQLGEKSSHPVTNSRYDSAKVRRLAVCAGQGPSASRSEWSPHCAHFAPPSSLCGRRTPACGQPGLGLVGRACLLALLGDCSTGNPAALAAD